MASVQLRPVQCSYGRYRSRLAVRCDRLLSPAMGRRKRRNRQYKNIQRLYDQSRTQDQQEQQLDQEEAKLLSKQLWFTCLARDATEGNVMAELNHLYGGVLQVRMHKNNSSSKTAAPGHALLLTSLLTGYSAQQQKTPLPRAVVEFTEPQHAKRVLGAQQNVGIFSMQNGQRSTRLQLVLAAGNVGHLKQPCTCRLNRRTCTCPGYVKVAPNRPTPNQSYHRGGAGQHTLKAVHLQVGSLEDGGLTLRPELDLEASCDVTIDLQQRSLVIDAPLSGTTRYLLVNRFRHLRQHLSVDHQSRSLTFTVRQPPKILRDLSTCSTCGRSLGIISDKGPIYELCGDPTASKDFGMTAQQCAGCVIRSAVQVMSNMSLKGTTSAGSKPAGIVGDSAAGADGLLGRCMTYRLTLHKAAIDELLDDSSNLLKKLKSFRLLRAAVQQQKRQQRQRGLLSYLTGSSDGVKKLGNELDAVLHQVDFDVGYHVLVLLSAGIATPWQVISKTFVQQLQQAAREDPELACKALAELSASSNPVRDLIHAFQDQLTGLRKEVAIADKPPPVSRADLYKVLRVHVTPTRVKFLLPEVQTGNRVVRHFSAATAGTRTYSTGLHCLNRLQFSTSHFLRVSFGDEGGDRMFGNREESLAPFFDRMKHVLQTGITVNGRKYDFLAFSSSQLKAWSTWMVADPQQGSVGAAGAAVIADALRHWLGNAMETEHVAAKCAARLGQAFSATIDAAEVQNHELSWTDDVERSISAYRGDKYCFSDGVGRISPQLLDEVLEALPFVPADAPQTSAIQVRFKGCKGVLSRYSVLSNRQLQLRPSMEKFGSDHSRLEVCSVAAWLPAYLNRQVIMMMQYNGVETEVFVNKLDSTLDQLARMCCSTEAALELVPALGGIETGAQDAMLRLLDVSVRCGLPLDPLADSCLKAVARWQVTDLRQKARLLVPNAVTLVGVMDECGVLEEDEVFVQAQQPSRGLRTPNPRIMIAGPASPMTVVLAKHPVAHRGDVRRVNAVDPRWRHKEYGRRMVADYVNVVVFSQKGRRPLPNQLSGSDLDGDQYMVLWDQELLQPKNSEPMDYTAEPPQRVDKVTVQHLQDHFVNFVKNDNLGQISTWLLAHADLNGADCSACEELARLHSMAVDFPKTGRPAEISAERRQELVRLTEHKQQVVGAAIISFEQVSATAHCWHLSTVS
eukprot:GHUV01004276.1.p1 GENE.GHUV01004276.1~~GHUV01004276.1.p1  ORF type:complete len:1186 (+),score=348.19 GHUV01004276.1:644-4201(+)